MWGGVHNEEDKEYFVQYELCRDMFYIMLTKLCILQSDFNQDFNQNFKNQFFCLQHTPSILQLHSDAKSDLEVEQSVCRNCTVQHLLKTRPIRWHEIHSQHIAGESEIGNCFKLLLTAWWCISERCCSLLCLRNMFKWYFSMFTFTVKQCNVRFRCCLLSLSLEIGSSYNFIVSVTKDEKY